MKNILAWILVMFMINGVSAQTIFGQWKTIDDESQKPRSIVEIFEKDGKAYGKVLKIFPEPDEDPDPLCTECDEDDYRYNKKVIGMIVMNDLEFDGDDEWEDGEILDPDNGEVYDCYITLESADKLKVRGYIGLSLLGRTQYWYRVK